MKQGDIPLLYFLLSLIFLLSVGISSTHAAVAIKMSMEPVNTGSRSISPGDGVRLRFMLIDMDNELIGGIMTDILFDKEILSISPDRDVKVSSDMQNKKTLYSNLIRDNKLRVMVIGFNDRVIPHGSELFTATFTVLRKPASLPGTMVYQHASSTSSQGVNIGTAANSLFIPVSDSTMSLASLSGTVSESGKGGLPSALVGLVSRLQPEIFFQTLTDSSGNYSLPGVIEGTYTLVAVKGNYNSYLEKNVVFSPGDALVKNITLTKGQIQFTFISPITPDEGTWYTSRSSITVSGITPQNTGSVTVQGKPVSAYTPADLSWYTGISLKIGENIVNASALDKDGKSIGQSSIKIVVTSAGKFKITNPADADTYETQAAYLTIGGLTAPETATIESNGVRIGGYSGGQTSWETSASLHQGINFFSFTAKDGSGKVVGTDSLSILSTQGGGGEGSLTIINPASSGYYQTGQSTISIGGQAPSSTSSLTMNSIPLAGYVPGSVSWSTSSLTLAMGDNNFTFKAFDIAGNLLGETGITINYQPGFVDKTLIIKVPTESGQYTAENQQLSLGGDTPSSTSQIRVNGKTISGYQAGSDNWSTTISLETGENQIVVAAYNAQGEEIGTDSITILFSQSFGDLFITQPTDAPTYQTKRKQVLLGGKTSPDTTEILVNDQVLSGYQANTTVWSYNASLPLGKTTFTVLAYDLNNDILGRDEIIITNSGVLEITRPTVEEDYVTGKKNSC
ncbi:MAG: carboxypeptidase-like regulatory domain-containing protein [bacterium]